MINKSFLLILFILQIGSCRGQDFNLHQKKAINFVLNNINNFSTPISFNNKVIIELDSIEVQSLVSDSLALVKYSSQFFQMGDSLKYNPKDKYYLNMEIMNFSSINEFNVQLLFTERQDNNIKLKDKIKYSSVFCDVYNNSFVVLRVTSTRVNIKHILIFKFDENQNIVAVCRDTYIE